MRIPKLSKFLSGSGEKKKESTHLDLKHRNGIIQHLHSYGKFFPTTMMCDGWWCSIDPRWSTEWVGHPSSWDTWPSRLVGSHWIQRHFHFTLFFCIFKTFSLFFFFNFLHKDTREMELSRQFWHIKVLYTCSEWNINGEIIQ